MIVALISSTNALSWRVFFLQASVDHGPMSQHRREPFIVIYDGYCGARFLPSRHELPHAFEVFAGLPISLFWFAHNDQLHLLPFGVVEQEVDQCRRRNCYQPVADNLQRVGNSDACSFLSVIYG